MKRLMNVFFANKMLTLAFAASLTFAMKSNSTLSAQAYYADDYSSSSVYAAVADNNINNDIKTIKNTTKDSNVVTKKTTSHEGRKVYNTIIIKSNKAKSEDNTTNKAAKIATPTNDAMTPAVKSEPTMETIKPFSTGMQKVEAERRSSVADRSKKLNFMSKIKNPSYKTTTDKWYLYTLASISATIPGASSRLNPHMDNIETGATTTEEKSIHTPFKYSGMGFTVGGKFYFSEEPQLFISPEFFYSKLDLGVTESMYTTKHMQYGVAGYGTNDTTTATKYYPVNLPVYVQIKPKDLFGGTIRGGVTLANMFSVFAKVSIGGMRSNFALTPNANSIDWNNGLANLTTQQRADVLTSLTNEQSAAYAGEEFHKNKMSVLYGIGLGAELTLWNQHLIIRADYDHYFTNSTITLNGTAYPRSTAQVNKVSADSDGTRTTSSGREWKNKMHFGIIKFSIGVGF